MFDEVMKEAIKYDEKWTRARFMESAGAMSAVKTALLMKDDTFKDEMTELIDKYHNIAIRAGLETREEQEESKAKIDATEKALLSGDVEAFLASCVEGLK